LTDTKLVRDKTLYRIRALKSFDNIKEGDLGGYIEKEYNLSQDGNCWIYDGAIVMNGAMVLDNAKVSKSIITNGSVVKDNAVLEFCQVFDRTEIGGHVHLTNCTIFTSLIRGAGVMQKIVIRGKYI